MVNRKKGEEKRGGGLLNLPGDRKGGVYRAEKEEGYYHSYHQVGGRGRPAQGEEGGRLYQL